jgi:hypothetical protein
MNRALTTVAPPDGLIITSSPLNQESESVLNFTPKGDDLTKIADKFCIHCGREAILEAIFCAGCGKQFQLNKPIINNNSKRFFSTNKLLMSAGSLIALIGASLGIIATNYLVNVHGFCPDTATLLIISLSGFASFGFSSVGLILSRKEKKLRK